VSIPATGFEAEIQHKSVGLAMETTEVIWERLASAHNPWKLAAWHGTTLEEPCLFHHRASPPLAIMALDKRPALRYS